MIFILKGLLACLRFFLFFGCFCMFIKTKRIAGRSEVSEGYITSLEDDDFIKNEKQVKSQC